MDILTLENEDTIALKGQDRIVQWHSVISHKNRLPRHEVCESQLEESCIIARICETLHRIFSDFHLIGVKFPT
jgi:hypothetical protein